MVPGVAPRLRFSCCSSREMPFREWTYAFRESVSEFRAQLREYPGPSQSSENGLFTPRVFFPKIGVVPRLLKFLLGILSIFFFGGGGNYCR